jgi:hypothetical protein
VPTPGGISIATEGDEPPPRTETGKPGVHKPFSVAVALNVAPPIGGTIGAGTGAPTYAEAFSTGLGGSGSIGYRILASVEGRVGLGLIQLSSNTFSLDSVTGPQTNELTDYSLFWFSLGPRMYFLIDRPSTRWFVPNPQRGYEGFCPFAGIQFGLTMTGSVDWPTPPPSWAYWDSGISSFFEIYAGAEHRFTDMVGAFAEFGLTFFGPPNPASITTSGMNEAGSLTAFRVSIGAMVAF